MVEDNEMDLSKGGLHYCRIGIDNGRDGLEITVKAIPALEEFIRSLGDGSVNQIELYGKAWFSPKTGPASRRVDGPQLKAYKMSKILAGNYDLAGISKPLILEVGVPNISFLRLVGISEGLGVRFGEKKPYSKSEIISLKTKMAGAIMELIREYLVPVHIDLTISAQRNVKGLGDNLGHVIGGR